MDICSFQPLALTPALTLALHLCMKKREKGVVSAAEERQTYFGNPASARGLVPNCAEAEDSAACAVRARMQAR